MLIIAPSYLHQSILESYRKDNPFNDVKVIDIRELVKASCYSVKDSALVYLMKKHNYSYDVAKMYLNGLVYELDESISKYQTLKPLQDELVKEGLLYRLYHLKPLLFGKNALVIGYQKDDKELNYFADKLKMKLDFFDFKKSDEVYEVKKFKQLEDEVYYVLNEIAHDLDSGVNIRDIVLVRRDTTYDYYLKKLSPTFGYQINIPNTITWYQTGVFSLFNKLVLKHHDFETAIEELLSIIKEDDLSLEFVEVVKQNILEEDFDFAYQYLVNKLSELKVSDFRYYPAVELSENIPFVTGKKIYLLGFAQGSFPRSSKDTGFFSEEDQEKLHLNSVKDDARFDQENVINSLSLDNDYHISYSEKSISNSEYHTSPIFNEIKTDVISNPRENYIYSEVALTFMLTAAKDLEYYFKDHTDDLDLYNGLIKDEFKSYKNDYTPVKAVKPDDKITLSYSSVNSFYECPFKYYVGEVLKLEPFEENNTIILGLVTHKILENSSKHSDEELSKMFDELVDESNADEEAKVIWKFNIKKSLLRAVAAVRRHQRYMTSPSLENEKSHLVQLDGVTEVKGVIDKTIIIDDEYIFVVDYKSGSSGDFKADRVEYGLSLQLPTYAFLLDEKYKDQDYKVAGLYIHHVYDNKQRFPELKDDELVEDYLKLRGITLADLDAITKFDSTMVEGKSSFIKAVKIVKRTNSISGAKDEDYFKSLIETTKEKYLEASRKIHNNEFNIYPYFYSHMDSACAYCKFRDICNVSYKQYHYLGQEEGGDDSGV